MGELSLDDRNIASVLARCADDLTLVCRLHDREPDADLLSELSGIDPRQWFSLQVAGPDAEAGLSLLGTFFETCIATQQQGNDPSEELAAEYADLYLTFGKRLAPNESYWLTDDHLERQEPMFAVRRWYAHYGLSARNWRIRADDHLVNEMEFVSLLLRDGRPHAVLDAGKFLDMHLMRWSQDFLGGIVQRTSSQYFAGLALVTEALLQSVRKVLETVTGTPRQEPKPATGMAAASGPEERYLPGVQPGW